MAHPYTILIDASVLVDRFPFYTVNRTEAGPNYCKYHVDESKLGILYHNGITYFPETLPRYERQPGSVQDPETDKFFRGLAWKSWKFVKDVKVIGHTDFDVDLHESVVIIKAETGDMVKSTDFPKPRLILFSKPPLICNKTCPAHIISFHVSKEAYHHFVDRHVNVQSQNQVQTTICCHKVPSTAMFHVSMVAALMGVQGFDLCHFLFGIQWKEDYNSEHKLASGILIRMNRLYNNQQLAPQHFRDSVVGSLDHLLRISLNWASMGVSDKELLDRMDKLYAGGIVAVSGFDLGKDSPTYKMCRMREGYGNMVFRMSLTRTLSELLRDLREPTE